MNKNKICFVMDNNPEFLGGTAIYVNNLITKLKKESKTLKISCVYPGKIDKNYSKNGIKYFEIKTTLPFPFNFFEYGKKVSKFLETKSFDLINSHAMAGYFMKYFNKKDGTKLINTYHGVAYYFYQSHLPEKNLVHKFGAIPFMLIGKILEAPPTSKADKIICVSDKVSEHLETLYGPIKNKIVIRSGVDTKKFGKFNRQASKLELKLDPNKIYFLYVGRGGFWTKGLDRAVKLIKEINKLNNKYNLLIIGPDQTKNNTELISEIEDISTYLPKIDRELIQKYYAASDAFFCFSRYEGGAPTLTLGEAMASGCLPICSDDSKQEIITNKLNGLIINNYDSNEAKNILKILENEEIKTKILKESLKSINILSIDNWTKKYYKAMFYD